jgi:hypothetical protein
MPFSIRRSVGALFLSASIVVFSAASADPAVDDTSAAPHADPTPEPGIASGNCEVDPTEGYRPQLNVEEGEAGTWVTASGPLPLYGQEQEYVGPPDWIELWWNLDAQHYDSPYVVDGRLPVPKVAGLPVAWLAKVDTSTSICFQVDFRVPDVPEGAYEVVAILGEGECLAALGAMQFVVTSTEAPT